MAEIEKPPWADSLDLSEAQEDGRGAIASLYLTKKTDNFPFTELTGHANGAQYRFRFLPVGHFEMGNIGDGDAGFGNDSPQARKVRVQHPFWIGETVVSRRFYNAAIEVCTSGPPEDDLLGANFGLKKDTVSDRRLTDHPVNLSWYGANALCLMISQEIGADVRLPTEIEWEYACRAGTTSNYWWGDDMLPDKSACDFEFYDDPDMDDKDRMNKLSGSDFIKKFLSDSISFSKAVDVNTFDPNPNGLFNMHGNVQEWCIDRYRRSADFAYGEEVSLGSDYNCVVARGGSLRSAPEQCTSWARHMQDRTHCDDNVGVRLVIPEKSVIRRMIHGL